MSVPIEGSYGVRGIVVTSRVFGKDIAAIGIGERECVLVQGVFLVKSVFRVSSLIFFGFRHEECRPVVCFTGCPSCRT